MRPPRAGWTSISEQWADRERLDELRDVTILSGDVSSATADEIIRAMDVIALSAAAPDPSQRGRSGVDHPSAMM